MSEPEPKLDIRASQQMLLDPCYDDIYNSLPAYLLDIHRLQTQPSGAYRLGDIKLVSRDQILEQISVQVEEDLKKIPQSGREGWCQSRVQDYKKKHRYAILSHRWGVGEPTFQQVPKDDSPYVEAPSTDGTKKLLEFCKVAAAEYGCLYAWTDTCCIDKKSSSEVEEAIRSMYRWYRDSEICVIYLGASSSLDDLKYDLWFTRGWTLQELLAPKKFKLYAKNWKSMNPRRAIPNDKDDEFVRKRISEASGIPVEDIYKFTPSCDRVSEKMTWMAPRKTKRIEDVAYSLIGLFDVTMPISYGEGHWAFHRLMEVIAYRGFDPGFFAWCGQHSPYSLALPRSPSCYKLDPVQADMLELHGFDVSSEVHSSNPSYLITKIGLEVKVLIIPVEEDPKSDIYTFALPEKSPRIAVPISTPTMKPSRATRRDRRYALGVINYHGNGTSCHGSVRANSKYLCMLLNRQGKSKPWTKEITNKVVVLRCDGSWTSDIKTIMLPHNAQMLS